jgi:hypothetical protein
MEEMYTIYNALENMLGGVCKKTVNTAKEGILRGDANVGRA